MNLTQFTFALGMIASCALARGQPVGSAGPATAENPSAAPRYELPPLKPASEANPQQPVRVDRVVFRGNKALRTSALESAAAPYLHQELSAADIEELRIALTRQYTDRGYINSGILLDPNAPYSAGVLSFLAIEGRIKKIRVHGNKG